MILTERDERRFWAKVALPVGEGCMLWMDAPNASTGYGMFFLEGKTYGAHRIAYVLAYGEIPAGLQIDHVKDRGCRYRHCVAPEHLEAVTPRENTLRGNGPCGINARKTCCKQGHAYDEENTYIRPDGGRGCRACRSASDRARARLDAVA